MCSLLSARTIGSLFFPKQEGDRRIGRAASCEGALITASPLADVDRFPTVSCGTLSKSDRSAHPLLQS